MGTEAHRERSSCPIAYSLDIVGDRWTLLILRDLGLLNRHHFNEMLASPEGISTRILADRLARLESHGLVVRVPDPEDGRRHRYFLTEDGVDLLPIVVEMVIWGGQRHPDSSVPPERVEAWRTNREEMLAARRAELAAMREG